HGAAELRFALEDEAFLREYLAGVPRSVVQGFRDRLQTWPERRLGAPSDAREQLVALLNEAEVAGLPDRPVFAVAVVFEVARGACNALDEYTLFLSPSHYAE